MVLAQRLVPLLQAGQFSLHFGQALAFGLDDGLGSAADELLVGQLALRALDPFFSRAISFSSRSRSCRRSSSGT